MANRQQRRQAERSQAKANRPRHPTSQKPSSEFGVEVDHVDGVIVFSHHLGQTLITTHWTKIDAKQIAKMIMDAVEEGDDAKAPEIIRESGIVVARTLP